MSDKFTQDGVNHPESNLEDKSTQRRPRKRVYEEDLKDESTQRISRLRTSNEEFQDESARSRPGKLVSRERLEQIIREQEAISSRRLIRNRYKGFSKNN